MFQEHLKLSLVKIPFIIVFLGFALLLIYSHPFWDNFIIVGAKKGDIRDGSIGIEQFGNLCIYVLLFASSCFVVYSSLMECVHYIISQDRKSTRLNSSHNRESRMPSSA